MELSILIVLILLNGVFAMSEIALVTARRARLNARAAGGDKAALAALELGRDPTRFLSTVQIGITSIGLLSGIVGEAALAGPLAQWLHGSFGLGLPTAHLFATVAVVVLITYASIVIGELVPKRLGQLQPENIACLVARPMNVLALISRPFVALLGSSTNLLLKMLRIRTDDTQAVTEEEIQALIEEGSQSGAIENKQHEMLKNIFRLDDRPASSIMLPRADLVYLDTTETPENNMAILKKHDYSWFPVCEGSHSKLIGVIHAKKALLLFTENRADELAAAALPPVFVPETLSGMDLLKLFQEKGMHIAFIVDEYGTLGGIVTIRDILEVLTGQLGIPTEDSWFIPHGDGWIVDGTVPVPELKDRLGLRNLPDEYKEDYTILNGMVMYITGRIPHKGTRFEWEGWRFEVLAVDGNKADKVLVTRLPEPEKPLSPEH